MDIVKEAEDFVLRYFSEKISDKFVYHSANHTKYVVKTAGEICDSENLGQRDKEAIVVAAWFHDTGYLESREKHEEASCLIARGFLQEKGEEPRFIGEVEKCILATRFGAPAESLNEKIICDADMAHAGEENFMEISGLLFEELENFYPGKITKQAYWQKTYEFITKIKYNTLYAQNRFEAQKQINTEKVKKRVNKIGKELNASDKEKQMSTSRGVESMFRLTARNQINLSSIADNKANIMLTINSLIISLLVSTSALNATRDINFLIPGIVLVISALFSLVFAILSVRPKISAGDFSKEELEKRTVNLLFFGNFYNVPYSQYQDAVKVMMKDYDFLYNNLIKDQYNLGVVLARKYKLLSLAYNFFMFGFIIAVVVFFLLFIFH